MVTPYLTVSEFRVRTVMPGPDVDALEVEEPGFLDEQILMHQSRINARLAKRYAVPFTNPPEVVLGWITDIVTFYAYKKRGYNPSAEQDSDIKDDAKRALEEVKEAANSKDGLFDLPLKEVESLASGVTRGEPIGYSEASPYRFTSVQAESLDGEPL